MELRVGVETLNIEMKVSPRSRTIRLLVRPDGQVICTRPRLVSLARAVELVHAKADWIARARWRLMESCETINFVDSQTNYIRFKGAARRLVREIIEQFNEQGIFSYNKITIKNAKSNWGSCSRQKNLNFNYKIVAIPRTLAEYLVAHELCHLLELNHSARFWRLVGGLIPDYKIRKKRLHKLKFL